MPRFRIENSVSGLDLGIYEGATAADALDAMAREAGYSDYAEVLQDDPEEESEMIVTPVYDGAVTEEEGA